MTSSSLEITSSSTTATAIQNTASPTITDSAEAATATTAGIVVEQDNTANASAQIGTAVDGTEVKVTADDTTTSSLTISGTLNRATATGNTASTSQHQTRQRSQHRQRFFDLKEVYADIATSQARIASFSQLVDGATRLRELEQAITYGLPYLLQDVEEELDDRDAGEADAHVRNELRRYERDDRALGKLSCGTNHQHMQHHRHIP